jgi:hypothetical protein
MMTGQKFWFLLRRLGESETLFFPIVVRVEEDEPALFGAEVLGLEGRLIAMGRSGEEAESDAITLFQAIVDDAIEKHEPLGRELGNGVAFSRVNLPLEQAGKALAQIVKTLSTLTPNEEWSSAPMHAVIAASAMITA